MTARFIEIRGGTGAGKSTLIREVMRQINLAQVTREVDPWVGLFQWEDHQVKVAVPGAYHMATGGLENRYTLEECIGLLSHAADLADVVLFEGGMLSKTTGKVYEWLRQQPGSFSYQVLYLRLDMKRVLLNLRARRGHALSKSEEQAIARDHLMAEKAVGRIKNDGVLVTIALRYSDGLHWLREELAR